MDCGGIAAHQQQQLQQQQLHLLQQQLQQQHHQQQRQQQQHSLEEAATITNVSISQVSPNVCVRLCCSTISSVLHNSLPHTKKKEVIGQSTQEETELYL